MKGVEVWRRVQLPKGDKEVFVFLVSKYGDGGAWEGEGSANPTDPYHTPTITQPSTSQPQKKQKLRKQKRKDTELPQSSVPTDPIADEAANEKNVPTHSNDLLLSDDEASLGDQEDASKQGRKTLDIDANEDITLDSTHFDTYPDMFGVHDLHGDESEQWSTPITSSKDKGKGIMVEEPLKMKKKDQVLFDEQEAIKLET
ncbi:hypothetical protein Tco_1492355 [Tanacetum coccineum]